MIASILPAILPTVGKLVDRMFPEEEAAKPKNPKSSLLTIEGREF